MLRHRPPDVEPAVVFFEPGADEDRAQALGAPTAVVATGRAREVWRARGAVRALRGAIRAWRADAVFAHVSKAQLYASPAARLERVPELWWQHEWFDHAPRMIDLASRLPAAGVICSSERVAAIQRARWPRVPATCIHPGIEPDTGAAPAVHRDGGNVVGIVGRLQRWKRPELVLHALPDVPGAHLRVIGDTAAGLDEDLPGELRALAQRLGVADRVAFTGHVPDARRAMAQLDVLVHCAADEPFGLVLVEAMLAGVPVIAPPRGGASEIVRDGVDGLLVEPTDRRALAAAIDRLLGDPALRAAMGRSGRARALERFTAERMAARTWARVGEVASAAR